MLRCGNFGVVISRNWVGIGGEIVVRVYVFIILYVVIFLEYFIRKKIIIVYNKIIFCRKDIRIYLFVFY